MADPSIPASPGGLTPEWLTRALRSTGAITDASVTSCRIELLGEGKGFSGQLARIRLSYDGAEASAPASMIAKFQRQASRSVDSDGARHFSLEYTNVEQASDAR
jgi:hypothetical protein